MKLSKVINQLCVFEPRDNGEYQVFPEGREISYKGTKEALVKKLGKKFPTLKAPMAFLMEQGVTFFYDPYFQEFRVTKTGLQTEIRNKGIQMHLANLLKYKKPEDHVAEFKNPWVSSVGFNNWNFLDNKDRIQDFLYEEDVVITQS